MKRLNCILIVIAALSMFSLPCLSQNTDENGHELVKLWKAFDAAQSKDSPKDALKILETIKAEAARAHIAWDWYDASRKYVDVQSSVNWKLREKLQLEMNAEVEAMGMAVLHYFHFRNGQSVSKMIAWAKEHREELESGHNPELSRRLGVAAASKFRDALPELLQNDYEAVVWDLYGRDSKGAKAIFDDCFGDRLPHRALADFHKIYRQYDSSAVSYRRYYESHAGTVYALLAEDELVRRDFDKLRNKGKEADFKALNVRCGNLSGEINRQKGDDRLIAQCCNNFKTVTEELNSRSVDVEVREGVAYVHFRNMSGTTLSVLKDKKRIYLSSVHNPFRSFYLQDTVAVNLPDLDDGEYGVRCDGGAGDAVEWGKYTLSAAKKEDSRGLHAYVADYLTGEPVGEYKAMLYSDNGKRLIAESFVKSDGGYAPLPTDIVSRLSKDDRWRYISFSCTDASGRLRLSKPMPLYGSQTEEEKDSDCLNVELYLDRTAFNPDETVNFKLVAYDGVYERSVCAGKKLRAELYDVQNNRIDDITLITNDFGSAAGSFVLKRGERGGRYVIRISDDSRILASKSVVVDDFVLPSYTLEWEEDKSYYLEGEEIVVRGRLSAYSGHSLSSASVSCTLESSGKNRSNIPLEMLSDGNFELRFNALQEGNAYYNLTVKVVDATGETREFRKYLYSNRSISVRMNALESEGSAYAGGNSRQSVPVFGGNSARFTVNVPVRQNLDVSYKLTAGRKTVRSGSLENDPALSGKLELDLDLADLPAGLYKLELSAAACGVGGKKYAAEAESEFFKLSEEDDSLDSPVNVVFRRLDVPGGIGLQLGGTTGETWAVVDLYGDGNVLLDSKLVHLKGGVGLSGSVENLRFVSSADWPENLSIRAIVFKQGQCFEYKFDHFVPKSRYELPLSFTRFRDVSAPGTPCSFEIRSASDVECAATVFDIATETVCSNLWTSVSEPRKALPSVLGSTSCGMNESVAWMSRNAVMCESARGALFSKSEVMNIRGDGISDDESVKIGNVREDFAKTLAWEPFLRSDEDGLMKLNFNSGDKLSKFAVQLFAHDKSMNNSVLRELMTVTLPVKLALVPPQYLYEGDECRMRVTLSSNAGCDVSGTLTVRILDGPDYRTAKLLSSESRAVVVSEGNSELISCVVKVPSGLDSIGVLANFNADGVSDALFMAVPVIRGKQVLTEAHSCIYRPGDDRDELLRSLRSAFVNVDGGLALGRELSIRQMLSEALPERLAPTSDNSIALADALYADYLCTSLGTDACKPEARAEIMKKMMACCNPDGGFAWFEGMSSSMSVTAALLVRNASMNFSLLSKDISDAAVRYLDARQFGSGKRPVWCGALSNEQYAYVRSSYPSVDFDAKDMDATALKDFRKQIKAFLLPGSDRGLQGMVFAKARRLMIMRRLVSSDDGLRLAGSWGIVSARKLASSIDADIESLLQYAVPHDCGGWYYPNLVMPFRGLLESEASAHAMICNLLDGIAAARPEAGEIARGIRLWLMLQKETQFWTADPAFLEALTAVFHGGEDVLGTKVIVMEARFEKPFPDVRASGNGFTVERRWFVDERELADGDILHLGDRIRAEYRIWNGENRSFVRLVAPRPASFRPVNDISGRYGWWLSPLRVDGWYSFSPQGYRSVSAERSEYWFDSYPEENSVIVEEFYATQEGVFQTPAVEIESLYAPHYRANDKGQAAMELR